MQGKHLHIPAKIGRGFDWNRSEYYHRVKRVILCNNDGDRVNKDSSHQGYNDVYINTYRRFGGALGLHLTGICHMVYADCMLAGSS